MADTEALPSSDLKTQIADTEKAIKNMEQDLHLKKAELSFLKKQVSKNAGIKWRESIIWCLDTKQKELFIKTPLFISKCISQKHNVQVNRDIKNKIATTLSLMFGLKLIGRISHEGVTYYGLPKYFKDDMTTLKREFISYLKILKKQTDEDEPAT